MKSDEYIEKRLEDQIDWYDKKSLSSQSIFKRMRKTEIILAASIPFITTIINIFDSITVIGSILLGLVGVSISILAGFIAFGQHQEHWIEYRTTCESLKKEKFLFQTKVEPYNDEDAFELLVQRVETLVSKENTNWTQYMINREKGEKNGK
ncbi:MAG: DUF4231 domain-containing protein [Thermotogota bacterium]|nr:DUF4231 domain-containing protein [Thermotogota bacterium]